MFLNSFNSNRNDILEEVDDSIKVELRTEIVKEHILAVALVELRDDAWQLVKHREGLGSVGEAGDHLADARLELQDLILELLVVLLKLVPLLADGSKFLRYYFQFVLSINEFFLYFNCWGVAEAGRCCMCHLVFVLYSRLIAKISKCSILLGWIVSTIRRKTFLIICHGRRAVVRTKHGGAFLLCVGDVSATEGQVRLKIHQIEIWVHLHQHIYFKFFLLI